VCAAGQFNASDETRSSVRIEAPRTAAEQIEAPIDATMARLARLENVAGFDPGRLSAAGRNLFSLADRWAAVRERLIKGAAAPAAPAELRASGTLQMSPVLATNLRDSRFSGFTQSQTATAWCGSNVVMSFNDSGAEVTTMASGRGVSVDGYALSSNRGTTFTYLGSPATSSDPNTFMSGDPVVACADAATFYYASDFLDGTNGISGVSLSISTDGGKTFAAPVLIAGEPSDTHLVDGASIAVDRATPGRLYVTYTDLDFSGSTCGIEAGSAVPRYAVETVSSADAGATWSVPTVVAQVCADTAHPFAFVGGSRVAVGPGGEVYVAWNCSATPTAWVGVQSKSPGRRTRRNRSRFRPSPWRRSVALAIAPIGRGWSTAMSFRASQSARGLIAGWSTWHGMTAIAKRLTS
jgi:hypothetical protein